MAWKVVVPSTLQVLPTAMTAAIFGSVSLAALVFYALLRRSQYEVQFLHRLQNVQRLHAMLQLGLLGMVLLYEVPNDPAGLRCIKALLTALALGLSSVCTFHPLIRHFTIIFSIGALTLNVMDLVNVSSIFSCHTESRCYIRLTTSQNRLLIIQQYASFIGYLVTIQITASFYAPLGFIKVKLLPEDAGIPAFIKQLAYATVERIVIQKTHTNAISQGNTRMLFDPKDPREQSWDETVDKVIGKKNRMSHPISRNSPLVYSGETKKHLKTALLKMGLSLADITLVLNDDT